VHNINVEDNRERKRYIIFGSGSFLSDIFDLIHANSGMVAKIYQNVQEVQHSRVISLRQRVAYLGYDVEVYDSLDHFRPDESNYEYVIGCTTVLKYLLIDELKGKYKITFCRLIHPEAYLGSNVHVGEGVIINARAIIAPNVYLDDFSFINRAVSIGHDARVGKFTRIGPSATLAGSTKIGDKCSIGISATILDRVHIGDWVVIGAGAVVTKDIQDGVIAYGVPAKVVRENDEKPLLTMP